MGDPKMDRSLAEVRQWREQLQAQCEFMSRAELYSFIKERADSSPRATGRAPAGARSRERDSTGLLRK